MEYSLLAALFGCYMAGATSNCCRLGARSVNTAQPCTSLQCRLIRSHIRSVYRCLGVPCHLHFWQNDRDLLGDTAVTRGWTGYRNKSQHIKMTPEKKIHPPLRPGLESATFRPRVRQTATIAVVATIGTFPQGRGCNTRHLLVVQKMQQLAKTGPCTQDRDCRNTGTYPQLKDCNS